MSDVKRYWLSTEGMCEARGAPGDIQGVWVRAEDYDRLAPYAVQLTEAATKFRDEYRREFYSHEAVVQKWAGWVDGFDTNDSLCAAYLAMRDALAKNPMPGSPNGRTPTNPVGNAGSTPAPRSTECVHETCKERDGVQLMRLLASAWFYGGWKAETAAEREMQDLMERAGFWPIENEDALIARIDSRHQSGKKPQAANIMALVRKLPNLHGEEFFATRDAIQAALEQLDEECVHQVNRYVERQAAVQKIARLLCKIDGGDPDQDTISCDPIPTPNGPLWLDYAQTADEIVGIVELEFVACNKRENSNG